MRNSRGVFWETFVVGVLHSFIITLECLHTNSSKAFNGWKRNLETNWPQTGEKIINIAACWNARVDSLEALLIYTYLYIHAPPQAYRSTCHHLLILLHMCPRHLPRELGGKMYGHISWSRLSLGASDMRVANAGPHPAPSSHLVIPHISHS